MMVTNMGPSVVQPVHWWTLEASKYTVTGLKVLQAITLVCHIDEPGDQPCSILHKQQHCPLGF